MPHAMQAHPQTLSTFKPQKLTRLYAFTAGWAAACGVAPCGDSSDALGSRRLARTAGAGARGLIVSSNGPLA